MNRDVYVGRGPYSGEPRPEDGGAEVVSAELEALLPAHDCELIINHNRYRSYYQTIEEAVAEADAEDGLVWASDEERAKAIETGEIWEIQWYPKTPVCFYRIMAASLGAVLRAAKQAADDDRR